MVITVCFSMTAGLPVYMLIRRYSLCLQDFLEMTVHHLATISLLYFSWMVNFVRIGSFVLIIHDVADPWLSVRSLAYHRSSICSSTKYSIILL